MTALAREAFARGADWVVPLDADEFLDVPDRSSLDAALSAVESHVAFFRWRHAVPTDAVLAGREPLSWPIRRWIANPTAGKPGQGKIVLHRSTMDAYPQFSIGPGNHRLIPCLFAKHQTGPDVGTMWHLPVRTRDQFVSKLRRDLASHTGNRGHAVAGMIFARQVKQTLLEQILSEPDNTATLRKIALAYWEIGTDYLSDTAGRAAPVEVEPRFAISDKLSEAFTADHTVVRGSLKDPASLDGITFAVARLTADKVVIVPGSRWQRFATAAETWLERNFTLGFRIGRKLGTSRAKLRIWRLRRQR
jgi:hypothetical protein